MGSNPTLSAKNLAFMRVSKGFYSKTQHRAQQFRKWLLGFLFSACLWSPKAIKWRSRPIKGTSQTLGAHLFVPCLNLLTWAQS